MPTYDYQCKKCARTFEEFQSIHAKALTKCPKCKGKIERLIGSGGGILFKGSGFYQTDYRSKGYHEAAKKDQPSAPSKPDASKKSEAPKSGDKGKSASS
ncbi:MAG: zinc ribbon domain-containing protein [Candidatus Omnitrophica bacterium]|nr:zinc ribbon domain-containing protein [Candidatus Omnitrophota bacterium]